MEISMLHSFSFFSESNQLIKRRSFFSVFPYYFFQYVGEFEAEDEEEKTTTMINVICQIFQKNLFCFFLSICFFFYYFGSRLFIFIFEQRKFISGLPVFFISKTFVIISFVCKGECRIDRRKSSFFLLHLTFRSIQQIKLILKKTFISFFTSSFSPSFFRWSIDSIVILISFLFFSLASRE